MRCGAAVLLLMSAVTAGAQGIPRGQSVADRPHSEYDQIGIAVGSFRVLPAITGSLDATNNYFAEQSDTNANVAATIRPEVTWRSSWSRHRLEGNAYLALRLNAPLSRENVATFGISSLGTYDISRSTQLNAEIRGERRVEDRTQLDSFRESLNPVSYNLLGGEVRLSHSVNRLTLESFVTLETRRYGEALLTDRTSLSQRYRNTDRLSLGGSGQYEISGGISAVVSASHSRVSYAFGPEDEAFLPNVTLNRNSTGNTLQGGLRFQLSSLIFGTLQAGLLQRDYVDPRLRDISGPTFTADLLWNVTPLTSLLLSGRRWVEESGSTQSAGTVRADLELEAQHELLRNLLLTGTLKAGRLSSVSFDAKGQELAVGLGARYLLNRKITVNGRVRHLRRSGAEIFPLYQATQGWLDLRYAY